LIATGARAVRPELTGAHLPGVIAFRTLAHLQQLQVQCAAGGPAVVGTYHPSQQNTQTGRLTPGMLDAVLRRAVELAA
jgi:uracil-DNA glycosylase